MKTVMRSLSRPGGPVSRRLSRPTLQGRAKGRAIFVTLATLFLIPTFSSAQKAAAPVDDWLVASDHAGPIDAKTSALDLKRLYGEKQVVEKLVPAAEGEGLPGCILLPYSPNRVEMYWTEDTAKKNDAQKRIASILLRSPRGRWHADGGVAIGTPLAVLLRRNGGKPIKFNGFDWDGGGYITDWGDGPLSKTLGGKKGVSVRLGYDNARFERLPDKWKQSVEGDRTVSSSDKAIRALQPTVDQISIDF